MRLAFVGVVPSPYQCDVLGAFVSGGMGELEAYWMEAEAPDSPWKLDAPGFSSRVLPGLCLGRGRVRSHFNWGLPNWRRFDAVVVNGSLSDVTTQWLMRGGCGGRPWLFWGERQGGSRIGSELARPLGGASGILAVGPRAVEDYRDRFPSLRVWELAYHCDLRPFQERLAQPGSREEIRFLFCGQMIRRKGVDVLLEAFSSLRGERSGVRLVMAGRLDREGELSLRRLGGAVRQAVEVMGFVPPGRLPELFGSADVFVLPSRREGWGVVVNQAAAAGLPLILSDAVEAGDIWLTPGGNGWKVRAGEAGELRKAMQEAVAGRERLAEMGAASARLAEGRGHEDGARRLGEILREVVG